MERVATIFRVLYGILTSQIFWGVAGSIAMVWFFNSLPNWIK